MKNNSRFWILCGAFGGLLYAINLSLGSGLTYVSGNPGFSGLITGITTAFILYILMRLTNIFGAITISLTTYCLLATPTVLMGPPGLYKIMVGFTCGLIFDCILYIFRYTTFSFLVGFLGYVLSMITTIYIAYIYLDLPQLDKFKKFMIALSVIFFIEGCIATWLGKTFFDRRLKRLSVAQKISFVNLDS